MEKEVGPIKYVAQLLFGGDGQELLDRAVQVFILMLVFVFDPLAVMLVIAANQTLLRYGINLESAGPPLPTEPKEDRQTVQDEIIEESEPEEYWDSEFEEQSRELYGDNMPDIEDLPSAVDDAANVMSKYWPDNEEDINININTDVPEVIAQLEQRIQDRLEKWNNESKG